MLDVKCKMHYGLGSNTDIEQSTKFEVDRNCLGSILPTDDFRMSDSTLA